MSELDIRLLQGEDLPQEAFPGGRNEPFRVFFTPEVHDALWKHAAEDTSVEICGVLVGSWHRDEIGPFAKITESIRGEGAKTRFAEVTFTHETWAKINSEMDTKYAALRIVGWYHTHPDFGIFLSDRDRFIQEHFFSGPGQVAHVIDPIRRTEGVFIWRDGKPTLTDHFWVGDRILTGLPATAEGSTGQAGESHGRGAESGGAARDRGTRSRRDPGDLLPPLGPLMIYVGVFLAGFLLATFYSGWERQRFVESWVDHNKVEFLLRVGLADELERLDRDVASVAGPLDVAQAKAQQADPAFETIRAQLTGVVQRIAKIRARYGNTAAVDDVLRRFLLAEYAQVSRAQAPSAPREETKAPTPKTEPSAPVEPKKP
ncbi:MAG: Mov34/MPN/PAD-1 family protein [Isosphaeraceae bacterium]